MKRKWLLIVGLLLVVSLGISGFLWWKMSKPSTSEAPISESDSKLKLLTWDDPAEFSFDYPEGVEIDKHDEDQENYAHLELTHPDYPGRIIVWAKDLPLNKKGIAVADAGEWASASAAFVDANTLDTTLGGEPAKKIMLSSPKSVIVGTVFDNLLWYVEGDFTSSDYWSSAFETITGSFGFKLKQNDATSGSEPDVVVDEEEVIE